MRILALETSVREASIALCDHDVLRTEAALPSGLGTAQTLAPTIADQLDLLGWSPKDINLIAVSTGPGSFTGLRVGITTAKTMAYALGADVLGLNTLEVIAAQVPPTASKIWAVMDAQRQQLFAACFLQTRGKLETVHKTEVIDNRQWVEQLESRVAVSGPALGRLHEILPDTVTAVDSEWWTPRAATVGKLAFQYDQQGHRDDLWKLTPNYFRKSAAEEKLDGQDATPS
ncbi:MAG: tRNA (adenosine(37)-N6)-threonylcarbamoyltransferase complex dimerization subunit type 1 TsaB [Planctomycetes bacterium]|nr:tRNA (adenosine(37)-N6)-threonylcarbamoyltransferase complex dimerization subunit type 1 TsaB [Planctomycetota bacterium]